MYLAPFFAPQLKTGSSPSRQAISDPHSDRATAYGMIAVQRGYSPQDVGGLTGLRKQDSQTPGRFWRAEAQLVVRRGGEWGVIHEKPGRIRAITSMCNLVFGVGFEVVDGAKKTSSAAIKLSAVRPYTVRERRRR